MTRPDHNRCVAMHGKPFAVSEVRGQMASGSNDGSNHVDTEVAGVKSCGHGSRWGSAGIKACGHGSRWGSNHGQSIWRRVSLGSAGVKACGGWVSADQSMWTRESLGVKSWSKHVERSYWQSAGVKACSGWGQRGQIMLTGEWLRLSGGQTMLTREWVGVRSPTHQVKSCGQGSALGVSEGQIMLTRSGWGSAGVKSC